MLDDDVQCSPKLLLSYLVGSLGAKECYALLLIYILVSAWMRAAESSDSVRHPRVGNAATII